MASQKNQDQQEIKTVRKRRLVKLPYDNYTVRQCLLSVKTGRQTIYGASKLFGIPESTIRYRLSDKWTTKVRKGPPTVLSKMEEEKLEAWVIDRQRRGIPISKETLYSKVKSFIDAASRPNPFRNSLPGTNC